LLGMRLLENSEAFSGAWNFGPSEMQPMTTQAVVEHAIRCWGSGEWEYRPLASSKKETEVLRLNWEKAANRLNWVPVYPWEKAVAKTVDWFKEYRTRRSDTRSDMYFVAAAQIRDYMKEAMGKGMDWCR